MRTKSKKRTLKKRNPVAKAAGKLRAKIVPDRRRKKLTRAERREAEETVDNIEWDKR